MKSEYPTTVFEMLGGIAAVLFFAVIIATGEKIGPELKAKAECAQLKQLPPDRKLPEGCT